jgi:hypothetical protein
VHVSGQHVAGIHVLQLGLRRITAEEEARPECGCRIPFREHVDVAHVIGFEDRVCGRWRAIKAPKDMISPFRRNEWIQDVAFATGIDAG